MLILLAIGPEERHGYAIMRQVSDITGGATKLGPGAVYTTIRRLLDDGLIDETDDRPDAELDDQRRRYYRLTALGRSTVADRSAPTRGRWCRQPVHGHSKRDDQQGWGAGTPIPQPFAGLSVGVPLRLR